MEEEEKKMSLAEEALDKLKGVLVTQVVLLKSLEEEKGIPELQGRADYLSGIGYDLIGKMRLVVQNEKMQAERLEWLKKENERLKEENARLEKENSQLKEENSQLKEENARLEKGAAEAEDEQLPVEKQYMPLLKEIEGWFSRGEEAAAEFITFCQKNKKTKITDRVGELAEKGQLMKDHTNTDLYTLLKNARLYDASMQNWNKQVNDASMKWKVFLGSNT